jgi:hypothetical protein
MHPEHRVALQMANRETLIHPSGTVPDTDPVGVLTDSCALGLRSAIAAPLELTKVTPQVASSCLIIPDLGEKPLSTLSLIMSTETTHAWDDSRSAFSLAREFGWLPSIHLTPVTPTTQ